MPKSYSIEKILYLAKINDKYGGFEAKRVSRELRGMLNFLKNQSLVVQHKANHFKITDKGEIRLLVDQIRARHNLGKPYQSELNNLASLMQSALSKYHPDLPKDTLAKLIYQGLNGGVYTEDYRPGLIKSLTHYFPITASQKKDIKITSDCYLGLQSKFPYEPSDSEKEIAKARMLSLEKSQFHLSNDQKVIDSIRRFMAQDYVHSKSNKLPMNCASLKELVGRNLIEVKKENEQFIFLNLTKEGESFLEARNINITNASNLENITNGNEKLIDVLTNKVENELGNSLTSSQKEGVIFLWYLERTGKKLSQDELKNLF
jgi:predicted transcriptional regulator